MKRMGLLSWGIACGVVSVVLLWTRLSAVEAITGSITPDPTKVPSSPQELVGPKMIKGQMLIKLRHVANGALNQQSVNICAVCARGFGRASTTYTSDSSPSLDTLIARYRAVFRRPLFRGESAMSASPETVAQLQTADNALNASVRSRYPSRTRRSLGAAVPDLFHWYLVEVSQATNIITACKEWAADPHVAACSPNYLADLTVSTLPNDTYIDPNQDGVWAKGAWGQTQFDDLWGLKKIQAVNAWPSSNEGHGMLVAVVDSGIDYNHADFFRDTNGNGRLDAGEVSNLWINPGEDLNHNGLVDGTNTCPTPNGDFNCIDDDGNGYKDDIRGFDFIDSVDANQDGDYNDAGDTSDSDPLDSTDGHGTHVAGTIAAVKGNSLGIAGVAPRVKVLPIRAVPASTDALAAAISYTVDNGADVISNSWGCKGGCPSVPAWEEATQRAHGLGAVVVFAAGNDSSDVSFYSPQNVPEVITVAASDYLDKRSFFSNFGNKIDVAAPGGGGEDPASAFEPARNILSLRAQGTGNASLVVGTNYYRQAGTSMACPHVSALAALILVRYPGEPFTDSNGNGTWDTGEPFSDFGIDGVAGTVPADYGQGNGRYDRFSNEDVRAALRLGADDIESAGRDVLSGFGRINALNSVTNQPRQQLSLMPVGQRRVSVGLSTAVDLTIESVWLPVNGVTATLKKQDPNDPSFTILDADAATDVPVTQFTRSYGDFTSVGQALSRPYKIKVIPVTVQPAEARLQLDVQGTGVSMRSFQFTVSVAPLIQGWPQPSVPGGSFMHYAPLLADLDGNGVQEIIVTGTEGTVYVWDTQGVPFLPSRTPILTGDLGALGVPVAANVDGDARPEILVPSTNGRLYAFNGDGTAVPGWPLQGTLGNVAPGLAVDDLDRDGKLDVVMTCYGKGTAAEPSRIYVWSIEPIGAPALKWTVTLSSAEVAQVVANAALGDVNGDGKLDVIANVNLNYQLGKLPPAAVNSRVYAWNHVGQLLWSRDLPDWFDLLVSSPSVGDLDGTGSGGANVVTAAGARVYVLRGSDGAQLQSIPAGPNRYCTPTSPALFGVKGVVATPTLADIDRDANRDLEILVGTTCDGKINVWNHDGTILPGWPQETGSVILVSSPIAVDLDRNLNDGLEVIQGSLPYLRAWSASGIPLGGIWPLNLEGAILQTPTVGDADGDGGIGLYIANWGLGGTDHKMWAFDLPGSFDPSVPSWPTLYHDVQRTSNAQNIRVPQNVAPVFNPPLPTSFSVQEGQTVSFIVRVRDANANLSTLTAASLPSATTPATTATFTVLGDIDGNATVDEADILLVVDFVLGTRTPTTAQFTQADLDGNGTLDIADIITLVNMANKSSLVGRFYWEKAWARGATTTHTVSFTARDSATPVLSATGSVPITVTDTRAPSLTVLRVKPFTGTENPPLPLMSRLLLSTTPVVPNTLAEVILTGDDLGDDPLTFTATGIPPCAPGQPADVIRLFLVGDATKNCGLSSLDATYILQAVTGSRVFDEEQRQLGDMSLNGAISALDATFVLQAVTGLTPITRSLVLWRPTNAQAGTTANFTVTVTDLAGLTTTVPVSIPVAPLLSVSLGASPDAFSPNGDGVQESTIFSGGANRAVSWTLEVKDSSNSVRRTFTGTGSNVTQTWDGKDSTGVRVPDGYYTGVLSATDVGGNTASKSATVKVDTVRPGIANLADSPDPFRPSLGQTTAISFNALDPVIVDLQVFNSAGTLVRTLLTSAGNFGASSVIWNGRNTAGTIVPGGIYTYKLWARDYAGNTISPNPAMGTVTVQ